MDLRLFGGWSSIVGALIEAVVFFFYAILLLRVAGKTTVGTARIFDFVSTVAMGTMIGSTIISSSTCSFASDDSASGSGSAATFQMAVRMGMAKSLYEKSMSTLYLFGELAA